ncbi:TonB-dependent receptor [Sphingomonas sp. Leaf357]|uniref:TonB-dependent receptor n=1 Tax=Sphingomonas sp. Leaf357 TaxID=1736350 RepID=UPI0006FA9912|nr:TonB-dependent receptor [Sphingomonas sp. Leaf357]KQS01557.1 TonB-dependent receptor [Sphingomonas sp. Leaf357]
MIALCSALPLAAQGPGRRVSIPATSLETALMLLGRQTGADIISTEPGLSRIRVRRIEGDLSPRIALDRVLQGSGYHAVAVDARSFRVVRDAAVAKARRAAAVPVAATTASGAAPEIVVTASKQRVPFLRYPGSLSTIDGALLSTSAPSKDLSDVARTAPVLQNTELGPGRNKIFIRGVADSSFAGAAQSTASIYFGDVQLGYSGADPSIRLYDMQSVEVMEGPQGTLYGTGSIGGVIRLTPKAVDLTRFGGSAEGGVTLTDTGAPGFDIAGTLNLPLATETIGLRATAYRTRDGGYIDDPGRGLKNVNQSDTLGGRLALKVDPGGGWQVDLSALGQKIDVEDGQYADRLTGALSRRSYIAQPFHNDIALGRVVVTKDWANGLQLLSATGVANSHSNDLFDATLRPPPGSGMPSPTVIVYQTEGAKLLLTHEMRLSHSAANGTSWVAGFTLLRNRDSQNRSAGPVNNPNDIIGVTNVTQSASVFAEGTVAVFPNFSATLGLRGTLARTDGEPSFRPRGGEYVRGRSTRRVDPTAAFSWKLNPGLAVFGRVQTGYRTGGLAVASGIGRVADFRLDKILVGEVGIRRLRQGETGLSLQAALSYARWENIQADLVNRRGLPYTDNIGDARIQAFEGTVDWVPIRGLRGTLAFLYTHNRVMGPLADSSISANRRLPETPAFAAAGTLGYEWAIGGESKLNVGGSAAYVGRSVLGTGDLLDISQGRYLTIGLNGGWARRSVTTSLTIDNLTNSQGNRFASGNPLTFAARDQTTPLRPMNARIGVAFAF